MTVGFTLVDIAVFFAALVVQIVHERRWEQAKGDQYRNWAIITGTYVFFSVRSLVFAVSIVRSEGFGFYYVLHAIFGFYWGWWAYRWWKRRPPREREPKSLGSRIRDLGHRLVVVPGGAS